MQYIKVSTHSRLKAADNLGATMLTIKPVSTHSRLKAAAPMLCIIQAVLLFQHTAA